MKTKTTKPVQYQDRITTSSVEPNQTKRTIDDILSIFQGTEHRGEVYITEAKNEIKQAVLDAQIRTIEEVRQELGRGATKDEVHRRLDELKAKYQEGEA